MYLASYVCRYSYASMISVIAGDLGVADSVAGLVTSGLFISYGAGQLISGRLGDRFKPYRLVLLGITCVSVINIIMSAVSNIWIMLALWIVNGFFHSLLWPPLVRFMSDLLTSKDYANAVVIVCIGSQCGNILVYLGIPLCLSVGWRFGFIACAGVGIAAAVVWGLYMSHAVKVSGYVFRPTVGADAKKKSTGDEALPLGPIIVATGMLPMFAAIVLQGTLRDGVQTWMPKFISDNFSVDLKSSILYSVALPIFAVGCYWLASVIQDKVKDELKTAACIFGVGAAAATVMNFVAGKSIVTTIIVMAFMAGSMHGVNLMLISRVPHRYARYGKVSTVSGIVNSFTYVGSAASTYLFPLIKDNFGWTVLMAIWALIAVGGTLFCLLSHRKWKRFISEE